MSNKQSGYSTPRAQVQEMRESPSEKGLYISVNDLEKIKAELRAEMRAEMRAPDDMGTAGSKLWMQNLALEVAKAGSQDTYRQIVPPEELERRHKARLEMEELILESQNEPELPRWRLKDKMHINNVLLHPAQNQNMSFLGIPNEAMLPIDDLAKRIYALFMMSIGGPTIFGKEKTKARELPSIVQASCNNVPIAVDMATRKAQLRLIEGSRGGTSFQNSHTPVLGTILPPMIGNM